MNFLKGYVLIILIVVSIHGAKRYDGYKLVQVYPKTSSDVESLRTISKQNPKLDFWRIPKNMEEGVDILVGPQDVHGLSAHLARDRINFDVVIHDLQKEIDEESRAIRTRRSINDESPRGSTIDLSNYHRYSDIVSWMESVSEDCGTTCSTKTIGTTSEGRDIKLIKIGKPSNSSKPVIVVDCGIHAREWISPATCVYFINELAKEKTAKATKYITKYDWYIIPVLNPDGYEYSHSGSRLWRKNRAKQGSGWMGTCYGVDLNRNFDFHWMENGASSSCSSDIYGGKVGFSEQESKALRNLVMPMKDSIKVYLTLHSYGQYWLVPYGYAPNAKPSDYAQMKRAADAGATALKAIHSTPYTVGNTVSLLYAAAGGSDDWAKGGAGIKYSYTLELRPKGFGASGFILNPRYIVPTGEETIAGVYGFLNHIGQD